MSGKPLENYNSEDRFRGFRGNSDVLRTRRSRSARPPRSMKGDPTRVMHGDDDQVVS
jgi:hypothetical protein